MTFLLLFMFVIQTNSFSQKGKYYIAGKLKVEKGGLKDAQITIEKNGQKVKSEFVTSSNFAYELDFQSKYVISFSKPGYVTKKISFSTTVPTDLVGQEFAPFEFEVNLFKQYDGVNTIMFNQPVGKISYSADMDDFTWDTDYTKSIQSALDKIMEEVAEKVKEEEKNQSIAEKQAVITC